MSQRPTGSAIVEGCRVMFNIKTLDSKARKRMKGVFGPLKHSHDVKRIEVIPEDVRDRIESCSNHRPLVWVYLSSVFDPQRGRFLQRAVVDTALRRIS